MEVTIALVVACAICIIIAWVLDSMNKNKYIKILRSQIDAGLKTKEKQAQEIKDQQLSFIAQQKQVDLLKEQSKTYWQKIKDQQEEIAQLQEEIVDAQQAVKQVNKEMQELKNLPWWKKLFN